jgi:hypothetical protein
MSCTPTAQSKILRRYWQKDQRRRLHEIDDEHEVSLAFEHGLKLAFSHVSCRIGAMLYPNCFSTNKMLHSKSGADDQAPRIISLDVKYSSPMR